MQVEVKLPEQDKTELVDRFIRYCKVDTQSCPDNHTLPSTQKQFDLAKLLMQELTDLGLKPRLTDKCYVYCTVPGNTPAKSIVGLLAHMDVSPDAPSTNVKPMIHKAITGESISLPGGSLLPKEHLTHYIGHDIITSDGSTLLGADDKCGVAAIMQLVTMLQRDPKIPHGTIQICFTPDEEIGCGTDGIDLTEFGAEVAYTVDGSELGNLESENFNAVACDISIDGLGTHPGSAYGYMVNASVIASEIIAAIPKDQQPQTSKGMEGYYYPHNMSGDCSHADIHFILRDFTDAGIEEKRQFMRNLAEQKQKEYPKAKITCTITEQYQNMKVVLDKHPFLLTAAQEAMSAVGVTPVLTPIRGGTDGVALCFMGLPTPNLFAGGINFHSKIEFVSIQVFCKVVEVLCALVGRFTQ